MKRNKNFHFLTPSFTSLFYKSVAPLSTRGVGQPKIYVQVPEYSTDFNGFPFWSVGEALEVHDEKVGETVQSSDLRRLCRTALNSRLCHEGLQTRRERHSRQHLL